MNNPFHHSTENASYRDGAVVCRVGSGALFINRGDV